MFNRLNYQYKKNITKKDIMIKKIDANEKSILRNFINPLNLETIVSINHEKIKTIVYVYQEKYINNKNCTGFGDFLRGFYFLIQFCKDNKYKFDLIINHPISKYFELKKNIHENISSKIEFFEKNNFDGYVNNYGFINYKSNDLNIYEEFKNYLNKLPVYNDTVYVYCINLTNNIDDNNKKFMKYFIQPSIEMNNYIHEFIEKEQLTNYNILHIRCGDDFLIRDINFEESEGQKILNNLLKEFEILKMNNIVQWIIISDNHHVKKILIEKYSFLKTFYHEITHTGENIQHDDIKIKNTLLEFYIMSKAKHIFSFSSYKHGSGFSKWCAETYNVPYACKYIGV
jgi:hypothetical protein